MAPAIVQPEHPAVLVPRQSSVGNSTTGAGPAPSSAPVIPTNPPACVGNCFLLGDRSECTGGTPSEMQTCVCKSLKFIGSVDRCFANSCTPDEAAIGDNYANAVCKLFNVDLATVTTHAPVATPTIDFSTPPVVINNTFINLQAIMSSICSLLVVAAILLGFFSCRSRMRRENQTQQGSWTNMATYPSQTGPGASKARSAGGAGPSRFGGIKNDFDPTATYASASYGPSAGAGAGAGAAMPGLVSSLSYGPGGAISSRGQVVSFGEIGDDLVRPTTTSAGRWSRGSGFSNRDRVPGINRGFTNRLTLDEMDTEEWELEERKSTSASTPSPNGSNKDLNLDLDLSSGTGGLTPPAPARLAGLDGHSTANTSKRASTDSIVLQETTFHTITRDTFRTESPRLSSIDSPAATTTGLPADEDVSPSGLGMGRGGSRTHLAIDRDDRTGRAM